MLHNVAPWKKLKTDPQGVFKDAKTVEKVVTGPAPWRRSKSSQDVTEASKEESPKEDAPKEEASKEAAPKEETPKEAGAKDEAPAVEDTQQ